MHLDAAGSLGGREPDDELEAVDVVLREREDEAERDRPSARELEVRDRPGERPLAAPDQVVLLRRAVDRDREHVHEPGERLPAPRGQEHAVGGDRRQHPELAGLRRAVRAAAVEQRLAARDRELPVAEGGGGLEAVREELQTGAPLGPSALTPSSNGRRRCCRVASDAAAEPARLRWDSSQPWRPRAPISPARSWIPPTCSPTWPKSSSIRTSRGMAFR